MVIVDLVTIQFLRYRKNKTFSEMNINEKKNVHIEEKQLQSLGNYLKKIISYSFYIFFITSFIFTKEINYISTEYNLSAYFKFLPNIPHPFDENDYFYANYENPYSDNYLSINHTYRKNKKIKSIKKLKDLNLILKLV